MAKDESFLLLSLSDSKAKKAAQAVSNESCRKILDYLTKVKHSTETKISEELKIPLPTVHYNLKMLVDVNLVNIEEFHYSEKGKEVNHYSLANKYIIIAPREETKFLERLKKVFPAFGLILAGGAAIELIQWMMKRSAESASRIADSGIASINEAAPLMAAKAVPESFVQAAPWWQGFGVWFFLGGIFALFIYTVVDWIKGKN